jgi:hypothetical protein
MFHQIWFQVRILFLIYRQPPSCCVFMHPLLCACVEKKNKLSSVPFWTLILLDQGSTLKISFHLISLLYFKAHLQIQPHQELRRGATQTYGTKKKKENRKYIHFPLKSVVCSHVALPSYVP